MSKKLAFAGLTITWFILCGQSLPEIRMLPSDAPRGTGDGNQVGSSRLAGVHTEVLFGDPRFLCASIPNAHGDAR